MRFIADTVTSVLPTCQRLFSPHRCYSLKPLPKGDWGLRVLWGRRAARSAQPYSQHPPILCSRALKPWAGTSTRIRSTRIPRLSHFSTARRSPRPRISLTNLLPTPKRRRRPSACGASPGPPLLSPNPRPPPPASKTGKVRAGPGQAPTGNAPQRGAAERCRVPTAGPRRAAPPPTLTPQLPLWRQPRARREPPQPFSPAFPAPPHTARPRPDARRENESGWRRRPALSWECGTTNPDVPRGAARGGSFEWGKESAQRCARGPCLGALWDCGGAPRGSFPSPASRRASKSTGWAL